MHPNSLKNLQHTKKQKEFVCKNCGVVFQDAVSRKRIYCSIKCRVNGVDYSGEKNPFYGKTHTKEIRNKLSVSAAKQWKKDKHWNWKGGVTPEKKIIRRSSRYKSWRTAVFERDDYTCRGCGDRGVYLEAHHINGFSEYPNLRFLVDNGITYCQKCHAKNDPHRAKFIKE